MKKYIILLTALLISNVWANEIKNLDLIKKDLITYHDSGQYAAEQKDVIKKAKKYLQNRLSKKSLKTKFAIVLDIDETALSNYRDMVTMNFGGSDQQIAEAEGKGTDSAINPTLDLYRYAKAHHVAVFFVTGRFENYREATERNLRNVGFKDWDSLLMKPQKYNLPSASIYKTAARKILTQKGYDIILNVGDQESDLIGGFADKTFKLPNPYYFIK